MNFSISIEQPFVWNVILKECANFNMINSFKFMNDSIYPELFTIQSLPVLGNHSLWISYKLEGITAE